MVLKCKECARGLLVSILDYGSRGILEFDSFREILISNLVLALESLKLCKDVFIYFCVFVNKGVVLPPTSMQYICDEL